MQRASCTMAAADYVEILEKHPWSEIHLSPDAEVIIAHYLPMLLDFAAQTPRLSSKHLGRAAGTVYSDRSQLEVTRFAKSIVDVFSGAWTKTAKVTSGRLQSPETNALLAVLRLHKNQGDGSGSASPAPVPTLPLPSSSAEPLPMSDELARISAIYAGDAYGLPPAVSAPAAAPAVSASDLVTPMPACHPAPGPALPPSSSKEVTWTALNQVPPLLYRQGASGIEQAELNAGPGGFDIICYIFVEAPFGPPSL